LLQVDIILLNSSLFKFLLEIVPEQAELDKYNQLGNFAYGMQDFAIDSHTKLSEFHNLDGDEKIAIRLYKSADPQLLKAILNTLHISHLMIKSATPELINIISRLDDVTRIWFDLNSRSSPEMLGKLPEHIREIIAIGDKVESLQYFPERAYLGLVAGSDSIIRHIPPEINKVSLMNIAPEAVRLLPEHIRSVKITEFTLPQAILNLRPDILIDNFNEALALSDEIREALLSRQISTIEENTLKRKLQQGDADRSRPAKKRKGVAEAKSAQDDSPDSLSSAAAGTPSPPRSPSPSPRSSGRFFPDLKSSQPAGGGSSAAAMNIDSKHTSKKKK